jgi:hypothetical protein
MGPDAMAILSLREAAEQVGKSKVDIWRAIQVGALTATRTDDGGFAIDPTELFCVFAKQPPEQPPAGQDATAPPQALERPETAATPETATTNDIAVAFAALQVELRGVLLRVAEVRADDELRQDKDENRPPERLGVIADKAAHLREGAVAGMEKAKGQCRDRRDRGADADPDFVKRASCREVA